MDIWQACSQGDVAAARRLLKKGADVDQASQYHGQYGETPLWIACFSGHVDVARLLLNNGAEVDRADVHGQTPLDAASHGGHADVVRLLLDALRTNISAAVPP